MLTPVVLHLVMSLAQLVVHASCSARLLTPPTMVVTTAVHRILQLLIVCGVHEEEEDGTSDVVVGSEDFGSSLGSDGFVSPMASEGFVLPPGSTSWRASNIGTKSSWSCTTLSTVSFVPLMISSLILVVVSTTQLTSENTVLNKPPRKSRLSNT